MMKILFAVDAAANAETYSSTDRPLWEQIDQALTAIKTGEAGARQGAIRWGANTAWVIPLAVHGRDEVYQIIWVTSLDDSDTAVIVHLGRNL